MDCTLSYAKHSSCFPLVQSGNHSRPIARRFRPLIVAASSKAAVIKCEFGGSTAPMEPRSPVGRFLRGVLLDDRDNFQAVAWKELERMAVDRDEAMARFQLSIGSDEASLHRQIAELKKRECQVAVEDVLYALILHKFAEISVHMVPKLSKCIYNRRLEIWPSKDWELKSIHSFDVLEMVREHITSVIGCEANSSITNSWAKTEVQHSCLCRFYVGSILYGYFLKSASSRHRLECTLDHCNSNISATNQLAASEMMSVGSNYIALGQISCHGSTPVGQGPFRVGTNFENLRSYLMGFDQETVEMCARPKSIEASNLIERHSYSLFGPDLLETDDIITTSVASVKRLLLEAVAFGSFLSEMEHCLNDVYALEENQVC